MDTSHQFRSEVEDAAKNLGASQFSILKWRIRGIPSEWQIKLFEKDASRFTFDRLKQFAVSNRSLNPQTPAQKESAA